MRERYNKSKSPENFLKKVPKIVAEEYKSAVISVINAARRGAVLLYKMYGEELLHELNVTSVNDLQYRIVEDAHVSNIE